MINLEDITQAIGSRVLFENIRLSFHPGHRYALTGPNGCGKSTLMRIMMGQQEATSGKVKLPAKTGFLEQDLAKYADVVVRDAVIMGNKRLWDTFCERDRLYEGEMTDAVGMRLGELEEIVAEEDGYSAEANAEELLQGIGIPPESFEAPLRTLPTDLQFRVLICQALFGEPEALLLDEPTNHLDLESIGWLEQFLLQFRGTMVVVSHDRHFLNSIATDIADIDYEDIILYPGDYDNMVLAKTAGRDRAEADEKTREKKIARLREFVAKFGAGTRASQVKSRQREMDRLQPQELKKSNIQRPYIRFSKPTTTSGKTAFQVKKASKSYDDLSVIQNLSFEIERGEKVAVIGNNGRGKTTLLKMLAGVIDPDDGKVIRGHEVQTSYFPQNHHDVVDKSDAADAFEWLRERKKGLYDQDIRSALGKLLFSGDEASKKVATLSGGETARLLLAGMMLEEHNVIILDEPNNHLDLESVSALSWALKDYPGTTIFASHDRDLIANVATKIIAFEEDGIHIFTGTYDEFLAKKV